MTARVDIGLEYSDSDSDGLEDLSPIWDKRRILAQEAKSKLQKNNQYAECFHLVKLFNNFFCLTWSD